MEYVYDIVLNFREEYYDFYEWHPTDRIINIKRVPIYKISNTDYLNIKNYTVTIDKTSIPKNNKIILLTCGIEVMGILLNNNGNVIKKSSLIFEEADDILEDKDSITNIDIKYEIIKKNKITNISRSSKEKISFINNYLKKLDKVKDEYLYKYIYYEIFNKEEEDIDIIIKDIKKIAKENIALLYSSIKKVNLELKR